MRVKALALALLFVCRSVMAEEPEVDVVRVEAARLVLKADENVVKTLDVGAGVYLSRAAALSIALKQAQTEAENEELKKALDVGAAKIFLIVLGATVAGLAGSKLWLDRK